jgi:hypothetical protein
LVNEACTGVLLLVVAKGIGGDGRLAFLDSPLCGLGAFLEVGPGFVGDGLVMPFANVAGENGGPGDDNDADID